MIAYPRPFRQSLLAGLCASALIMGGCSGGDKSPAEEITIDAASLELTKQDETALSRHFEITPRGGDEAATLAWLTAAGFDEAQFADRQIEGSTVVYTDWTATDEETNLRAARVELIGVVETDDGPTLDKLVIADVAVDSFEGEGDDRIKVLDATIGDMVVVSPSAAMFSNLANVMLATDNELENTVMEMSGANQFRAFQIQDVRAEVTGDDGKTGVLTLKQSVVGAEPDNGPMDVVLETFDFEWGEGHTGGLKLAMDGLTVMGLNIAEASKIGSAPTMGGSAAQMLTAMMPTAKAPYRELDLGVVELRSGYVDLDMEGVEAKSDIKGDVTTLETVFLPMVMNIKNADGTPIAPYMDVLGENGLAEITMKGSSTTTYDTGRDRVAFTDNLLEIDDGLRYDCDYALLGLNAAAKVMDDSGLEPPTFDVNSGLDSDAAMEKYFADAEAYGAVQTEAGKLIKLEGLNCDVQDVPGNSLVERGYAVASEITGKPVAVLKGGAKTMIALGSMTAQSEFQRDMLNIVGSGLIDFIDTPGQTMTITMTPDQPVSLMSLTGEDASEPSIKPLNMKVEVR